MVFAIMASLAQFESALIGTRVKAGMERARAQGKHLGRPPLSRALQAEIRRLWEQRASIYRISKRLSIAYSTARHYVRQLERGACATPAEVS